MSALSSKTEQEISELLDEYGIKHGPVVGKWLRFTDWTNVIRTFPTPVQSSQVPNCSSVSFCVVFCPSLFTVWPFTCSGSTRSLYEKKLREAMAKGKRAKPASDKTYYREEGNFRFHTFHPHSEHTWVSKYKSIFIIRRLKGSHTWFCAVNKYIV